jgi:hypothetical protein
VARKILEPFHAYHINHCNHSSTRRAQAAWQGVPRARATGRGKDRVARPGAEEARSPEETEVMRFLSVCSGVEAMVDALVRANMGAA